MFICTPITLTCLISNTLIVFDTDWLIFDDSKFRYRLVEIWWFKFLIPTGWYLMILFVITKLFLFFGTGPLRTLKHRHLIFAQFLYSFNMERSVWIYLCSDLWCKHFWDLLIPYSKKIKKFILLLSKTVAKVAFFKMYFPRCIFRLSCALSLSISV